MHRMPLGLPQWIVTFMLGRRSGEQDQKMWVKMRALLWAISLRRVAAEVIATILPSHGQSPA